MNIGLERVGELARQMMCRSDLSELRVDVLQLLLCFPIKPVKGTQRGQPALGDDQSNQRDEDGVHHLRGLIGEEDELHRRPGEIRPDVFNRGADEHRPGMPRRRPCQELRSHAAFLSPHGQFFSWE
jgi:hypothetical protein